MVWSLGSSELPGRADSAIPPKLDKAQNEIGGRVRFLNVATIACVNDEDYGFFYTSEVFSKVGKREEFEALCQI